MKGEARGALAGKPGDATTAGGVSAAGAGGKNPFQCVLDKENKPDGELKLVVVQAASKQHGSKGSKGNTGSAAFYSQISYLMCAFVWYSLGSPRQPQLGLGDAKKSTHHLPAAVTNASLTTH